MMHMNTQKERVQKEKGKISFSIKIISVISLENTFTV